MVWAAPAGGQGTMGPVFKAGMFYNERLLCGVYKLTIFRRGGAGTLDFKGILSILYE